MELTPDFDEFIASLTAHGLEFVVVGAYALACHGDPRFSGDLDILVRPSLENAARVLEALKASGFPVPELRPETLADRALSTGRSSVQSTRTRVGTLRGWCQAVNREPSMRRRVSSDVHDSLPDTTHGVPTRGGRSRFTA